MTRKFIMCIYIYIYETKSLKFLQVNLIHDFNPSMGDLDVADHSWRSYRTDTGKHYNGYSIVVNEEVTKNKLSLLH